MNLPRLRADQLEIAMHPAKTKVLCMGRLWGKTVLGGALCGNALAQHGRVAWIAPTYKNTRAMWRWLLLATAEDVRDRRINVSKTDRIVETKRGGFLGIFSGDNIDSVRGEAFHLVVVDEAARIPETAWSDAIMPTLADYGGDAILISTPKGKNWFYHEWLRGSERNSEIASWMAPTGNNPACMHAPATTSKEHAGHTIVAGLDLAKQADFTAISIGCRDCRTEIAIDRFNQVDYLFQVGRVKAICEKWGVQSLLVDSTGVGSPVLEQLQNDGLPAAGFLFTATSKPPLIENMTLALERTEWQFIEDRVWTMELEAYERTVSPTTGRSTYSAPDGGHDDTVMSRSLMLWQARNSVSLFDVL